MLVEFKPKNRAGRPASGMNYISIYTTGQSNISANAMREFGLENMRSVKFFFDEESNQVGFKFSQEDRSVFNNRRKVVPRKNRGIMLSTVCLYKDIGLTFGDERKTYELHFDQDSKMATFTFQKV